MKARRVRWGVALRAALAIELGVLPVAALADNVVLAADPAMSTVAYQATACEPPVARVSDVSCGWLTTPENWREPGVARVRLPIWIFAAADPDPTLEPVIFLTGGPGFPALGPGGDWAASWRDLADAVFPGRRFITFDMRGSGAATPLLDCPDAAHPEIWWEISDDPSMFPDVAESLHGAYADCAARLIAAGHDLEAYSVDAIAADAEALRRALGLERVALFGSSFGTRAALEIMRDFPDGVYAAVLDSTLPAAALDARAYARMLGALTGRMFDACAKDRDCATAFPDLRANFSTLLETLNEKPAVIEVFERDRAQWRFARIDANTLLDLLWWETSHTRQIPHLPSVLSAMARGAHARLRPHFENSVFGDAPREIAMGMHLSVMCQDRPVNWAGAPEQDLGEEFEYLEAYAAWLARVDICDIWPVPAGLRGATEPVVSDIPSLLLAGVFDGATPIELSHLAAETLSNGYVFSFPGAAHGQIGADECADTLARRFLRDPSRRPYSPCVARLKPPDFITP